VLLIAGMVNERNVVNISKMNRELPSGNMLQSMVLQLPFNTLKLTKFKGTHHSWVEKYLYAGCVKPVNRQKTRQKASGNYRASSKMKWKTTITRRGAGGRSNSS